MEQIGYDEAGHAIAKLCPGGLVKAKMLSGIAPAEERLLRCPGKTNERALHTGKNLRGEIEAELIGSKKRCQHGGCGGANGAVRSRIGRIRRRRPRLRKKVRVGLGIGVAVCIGGSDGGYRPPEGIGVLRVVERD